MAEPAPIAATGREAPAKRTRRLITPEGVDLRLELADSGERVGALLIDLALIVFTLVLVTLGLSYLGLTGKLADFEPIFVIWVIVAFLLRNAYFAGFELSRGAATPGKRLLGLRVATRSGGRLTADAVIARNAMREIEIFLPLSFLFAAPREQVDAVIVVCGLVWSGVFLFLPLFNRDRLRAGDLVAGTWVVRAPRRKLAPDLARTPDETAVFAFTPAQLDAYGVMELQVLEDVLRRSDPATVKAVARRIRDKIGWTPTLIEKDRDFLEAYYTRLRGKLEAGLLFGRRRKDKNDR